MFNSFPAQLTIQLLTPQFVLVFVQFYMSHVSYSTRFVIVYVILGCRMLCTTRVLSTY